MLKNNILKIDINELIDKEIFCVRRQEIVNESQTTKKAEQELNETQLVVVWVKYRNGRVRSKVRIAAFYKFHSFLPSLSSRRNVHFEKQPLLTLSRSKDLSLISTYQSMPSEVAFLEDKGRPLCFLHSFVFREAAINL